jgi:hypothetical protein
VHDAGRKLADRLGFLGLVQFLRKTSSFLFGLLMGGYILKAVYGANELPLVAKEVCDIDQDGEDDRDRRGRVFGR